MVQYRPGRCNIGFRNRLSRFGYAIFFFALSFLVFRTIQINHFPEESKAILFIPLFASFLYLYETLFGFCVNDARKGVYEAE